MKQLIYLSAKISKSHSDMRFNLVWVKFIKTEVFNLCAPLYEVASQKPPLRPYIAIVIVRCVVMCLQWRKGTNAIGAAAAGDNQWGASRLGEGLLWLDVL